MADDNEQSPGTPDGTGLGQSDIDALFSGADGTGDGGSPGQPHADASQPEGGESPAGSGAETGPVTEQQAGGGAVSQADIDALLGASASAGIGADDTPPAVPDSDASVDTPVRPSDGAAAATAAVEGEHQTTARVESGVGARPAPAMDSSGSPPDTQSLNLTDLEASAHFPVDTKKVTMLNDVKLQVKLQLGRTKMLVEEILDLDEGSVVELDKLAGDPIDVLVNDRLVARGEVLVLNDNFCVRISEVISHDPHRITT